MSSTDSDEKDGRTLKKGGAREWTSVSYNCVNGCSHDCRYCYARHMAVDRFGRLDREEWRNPVVREKDIPKSKKLYKGWVMFPATHDILPEVFDECLEALTNLLKAGNNVLVVSKPHLKCVKKICKRLKKYADHDDSNDSSLAFRFTIGSDDDILGYWEPNAPGYEERFKCLKYAYERYFSTSISIEPMLDPENVLRLIEKLSPYVTDKIWLGLMNKIDQRVEIKTKKRQENGQRFKGSL